MTSQPIVITPLQQPRPLNVVGMQITVLAANSATGSYGVTLQGGDEGSGPPLHHHDWDEAFYVLKGNVHFECDSRQLECGAGTLVHVPRGTRHAFTFGSGGGLMLEITGAGANAAEFFTSIDRYIPAGELNLARLNDLADLHGVVFTR